jgi:hypothetical protein
VKEPPKPLPISTLDRVEYVADCRYLLCHHVPPVGGEDVGGESIAGLLNLCRQSRLQVQRVVS